MVSKTRITVFTPTYNRAHTINRTYKSLCNQTCKEFIWLIIDDGSSDNTRELVEQWINEDIIQIQYIYKENGGMHTAHNTAYNNISTELNICIDSDDQIAENAIDTILTFWEKYGDETYAGLVGLDATLDGRLIGKGFPDNLKDTTLSSYYATGGKGDKKLVYRTDVIKRYQDYPEYKGERLVPLGVKYTLIDQDYKLLILNEVLCYVEYQDTGSSNTIFKQYIESPKGFSYARKINMVYGATLKKRFLSCIHYVSSSIFEHNKEFYRDSPKKIMTLFSLIPGTLLNIYIRFRVQFLDKFQGAKK
ncbi:glycosyltransferase family 2 protein [Mesobacillus harenae]|uniref:glycosyltransferase family 2 protein n=1 Tax=Mesobacillus harenae TaxID=2213203 RepID=UPI0015812D92|nr:glycosyltransferase family 2 protein [Mesobacillus harenae]